jgi:hypothetical protein
MPACSYTHAAIPGQRGCLGRSAGSGWLLLRLFVCAGASPLAACIGAGASGGCRAGPARGRAARGLTRRGRPRQGLVPEKKVFEVHIEQGHKHGAKVVLRGEAGCSDPNVQPGDVVFVLEQRPHKQFKRVGNDLVLEKVRHFWRPLLLRYHYLFLMQRQDHAEACKGMIYFEVRHNECVVGLAFAAAARRSRGQRQSLAASMPSHTVRPVQLRAARSVRRAAHAGAGVRAGHLADGRAVRVHV